MRLTEVVRNLFNGVGHIVVDRNGNPRQISSDELRKHRQEELEFRQRLGIVPETEPVTIESLLIRLLQKFI